MQRLTLTVKSRLTTGTGAAKKMRREGSIPAILYGHGMKPMNLQVGTKDLYNVLHTKAGANVLIDLSVPGVQLKESTCRIKAIQHDPVTEAIDHVDFTVISLTEKIEVNVRLIVPHQAEIEGVKEGGILDIVHHEVKVECLPTAIPEKIELQLKAMKIGDAVHAKDLKLPEGVKCLFDSGEVIVALHAPRKEEEPVAEEGAAQPEVIEKGKKEEEGEVKAEVKKEEPKKPEAKK
jgi:large subunit ribosomal protein L25